MNVGHLVEMVNDISSFYVSGDDRQTAAASVESHIARYWEKRMRREIVAHYRAGGEGLSELSREALAILIREGDDAPRIHSLEGGTGGDAG